MTDQAKQTRVGVSIVIHDGQGRVLLGLRKSSHATGTWGLPGGAVEPGEDPHIAARRELEEETGLRPIVLRPHFVPFMSTVFEDGQHWITLFYEAEYCGEPDVMEPAKCEQWGWSDVDALPSPLFPALADGAVLHSRPLTVRVFKVTTGADYWVAAKDSAHAIAQLAEMASYEGWDEEFMEEATDGIEVEELLRESWNEITLLDDGSGTRQPISFFLTGYGVFGSSEWP